MTDGAAPHPGRVQADAHLAALVAAHARAPADVGPMVEPCDPTPRPPLCGVTSAPVPRDPPGMSHRVPPAPSEPVGVLHADLFADLARCRAAVDRMGRRVVSRERGPARLAATAPPLPHIPELLPGVDAAARASAIDRAAALIRELTATLDTAPPDVATRARRALAGLVK